MKEKVIEKALVNAVKQKGGLALKLVCPGFDGMPDRIVLLPKGKIGFAETKASNKKPRPLQIARHRMLKLLGFKVFVLDDITRIQTIIDELGGDGE